MDLMGGIFPLLKLAPLCFMARKKRGLSNSSRTREPFLALFVDDEDPVDPVS